MNHAMQRTHSSAGWLFHLGGLSWSEGTIIINKTGQLIEQNIKKLSTANRHNCSVTRFVAANDWARHIDEAPQNSSSQNLTRKVKYWRDWTYTDGSLQKNEIGQDTGSGVYHPHFNVSHYVNPKGMGITNTISRAELAAIAAAVIHGYSHIATDSLTSLHQFKKQLSHPNLHRHHIQGDVLQSIAKAIRQSPSPIHFFKVKSHANIW